MSQPFTINKFFRKLKDPRINRHKRHLLIDIVTITICAVICGCNDWQQLATFARCRLDWFKKFLHLPHGTPSHDTFERVFDRLDPLTFQACFRDWMNALHQALGLSPIAIDGKTLRGSGVGGMKALHLVSAWATANCLSLGQVAVEEKSNEITAIPRLLELLDVHGALVTIDAMGCQKAIATQIVDGGGDYILTAKDNQPSLVSDIESCFEKAAEKDFVGVDHDSYTTTDTGHGREETRHYQIIVNPEEMPSRAEWKELKVIGMCYTETERDGKVSSETRYFIGSRKAKAKAYGNALRGHWGIENKLHWQLDVGFDEDMNRVSKRHGAENLALVRRLALSLLLQHPGKGSVPCKRLEAALNPEFLKEILVGDGTSGKI